MTSSSLIGVVCVLVASVNRFAARRNWLNAVGCVFMLGAAYKGQKLERKQTKPDSHFGKQC